MADQGSKLQAYAAGGPNAAQDYEAAKSDTGAIRQQALTDAANRSGAMYAPSEFRSSQSTMIGAPLDSAIAGLGAQQGAAGAYSGSLDAAKSSYLGALAGSQGLIQDALRSQSAQSFGKALNDVSAFQNKQQAAEDRRQAAEEKRQAQADKEKKKLDDQNKDFAESAKTFALQDATVDPNIDGGTLEALHDLTKFSSLDEAIATLNRARDEKGVIQYADGKGNPIALNEQLLNRYLVRAYGNDPQSNATPYGQADIGTGLRTGGDALTGDAAARFKQLYGR
jgi:hypothetical protein